jgi:hypothetical protein
VGHNAEYLKSVTGELKGTVLELSEGIGYLDRGELRLDPSKSPKQFDLTSLGRDGKPRPIKFFTTGRPGDGREQERPVSPLQGDLRPQGGPTRHRRHRPGRVPADRV